MTEELTVDMIMLNTPKVFNPEAAEGVNATVQFHFTGEQAGEWILTIADGKCTTNEGTIDNPTLTMTVDGATYVKIIQGEINAMQAFMQGLVVVKGDMMLAMKFPAYFKMGGR